MLDEENTEKNLQELFPDTNDDELVDTFENTLQKLLGILNISLEPTKHTYTVYNNKFQNIILPLHFVIELTSITSEYGEVPETEYLFNKELGMIRFKNKELPNYEMLTIIYVTKIPEHYVVNTLYPIVYDMMKYDALPDDQKNISSIHEGNVSIGYDTGSSLYAIINNRINQVKSEITHCSVMII
ncbi:MAG: hypothetical protein HUJ68_08460 [Clostridia bacterium]|nr:hypothetical protein [Clostridia bacterium]